MLLLEIIAVGKVRPAWLKEGIDYYRKLTSKYARVEVTTIRDSGTAHLDRARALSQDSDNIVARLDDRAFVLALDERGKIYTSLEMAALLCDRQQKYSRFQFIIGGAHGLAESILHRADLRLSLSAMTLPHEMCQMILLEQLYRALAINAGASYHK